MISVRERPPTRLSALVTPPGGGPSYRWGADDPNVRNVPNSSTFATSMPGGFDGGSLALERDTSVDWADLQEFSTVTFFGLGGAQVAHQSRIEGTPSTAGSEANFAPTLGGWQNHLQDTTDAAMIYLDGGLPAWGAGTPARQYATTVGNFQNGDSSVGTDLNNGAPALILEIDGSWVSPFEPYAEAWYTAAAGCLIAKIFYTVSFGSAINTADAHWIERVFLAPNDVLDTGYLASANLLGPGSVSGLFDPGTAMPYALVQSVYTNTPAGTDNQTYQTFFDALQVIGNHGLPLGGSGPYTILASDVIAHAVTNWAPKLAFTTGPTGTIQPSSYGIPQLTFSATTPLAIIQQASEYEILDYAVWEQTLGTTGPTLYVNARGARGRRWVSRIGDAQLQNTGPQVSRIYNGVIVTFTAPDGTAQTVGPPGSNTTFQDSALVDADPTNPANLAGINRWYPLQMGSSVPAAAIDAGAFFLQAQAAANTAGQAILVGHVRDLPTGSWWPAWMVRAGDTIVFSDAADTSPRRIVSTSYDASSITNTVQLDSPADSTTALLDRLSAVLAPLGLT
jgi:hypothetical protein